MGKVLCGGAVVVLKKKEKEGSLVTVKHKKQVRNDVVCVCLNVRV